MSAASAPVLAPDAAMALGIASTALPFAQDRADAAERWLRILRMHGRAGVVLQALGVSEGPLYAERPAGDVAEDAVGGGDGATVEDTDVIAQVIDRAVERAHRHGAAGVATTDVLLAAMDVYGADFDRVLRAHGADSEEVRARLEECETCS